MYVCFVGLFFCGLEAWFDAKLIIVFASGEGIQRWNVGVLPP